MTRRDKLSRWLDKLEVKLAAGANYFLVPSSRRPILKEEPETEEVQDDDI